MAKDPAFLFYPNDWLGGTMGMTFEQKGAYMELLMLQFNRGHMTEHMIGQTVGCLWDDLKDKFIKDDNGCWYNLRLQEEKIKRKLYVDSRLTNKSGKNQYTKKDAHMTSHMEDVDVVNNNTTININTVVKKEDKELGIILVKEVANKVWADKAWIETLCMSNGLKLEGTKDWMAQFNLSVSQDAIPEFDEKRYKKLFGGWLRMKLSGGQKIVKVTDIAAKEKELMKSIGL